MTLDRTALSPILVAAGAAIFVALLGASMTELGPWYHSLREPAWKPPDWLFGPAWTLIFATVAAAGYRGWRAARTVAARRQLIVLFGINTILNVAWSTLFFRVQRPDWALAEVVLLWLSIAVLIVVARRHAPSAAWLLVPYLLWVSFAGWLNLAVVRLNAPF